MHKPKRKPVFVVKNRILDPQTEVTRVRDLLDAHSLLELQKAKEKQSGGKHAKHLKKTV